MLVVAKDPENTEPRPLALASTSSPSAMPVGNPAGSQTRSSPSVTITRNLDINAGRVKNRRVIVHDAHRNFVTIRLIGTNPVNLDNTFCIPRINFSFQPARCP